jgi:hypothetical protein
MADSCDPGPLPVDEKTIVDALVELARLEQSGDYEPAPVLLGPYSAYILISALQLAWRHPDLLASHKRLIENVARPLQELFGPPLAESIELGWLVQYDQAPISANRSPSVRDAVSPLMDRLRQGTNFDLPMEP